jgi:hypothetical protein
MLMSAMMVFAIQQYSERLTALERRWGELKRTTRRTLPMTLKASPTAESATHALGSLTGSPLL